MVNIQIAEQFTDQVNAQALELVALSTLSHEDVPPETDLSIVIADDAHLQELNNQFLGIEAPTDVLSFPSGESEPDLESGRVYIGDVVLSYPRAAEQAEAAGHPVVAEMQLLVVHGVLHLLGYDHYEPDEKAEMWAVQGDILQALGIEIKRLPE